MNDEKKDYRYSIIRGCALLLVIACHTSQQYGQPAIWGDFYSVGVQIFLFLSGFLYARKSYDNVKFRFDFVKNNFNKILIDYYVYIIIFALPCYYIYSPDSINRSSIFKVITCSGTIGGIHHLWYIPYILMCYLLTPLMYDMCVYIRESTGGGVLGRGLYLKGIYYLIIIQIVFVAFNSYFVLPWLFCYFLGFVFRAVYSQGKDRKLFYQIIWWVLPGALALNLGKIYIKYILDLKLSGAKEIVLELFYDYAHVFLAVLIFTIIYIIGDKLIKGNIDIFNYFLDLSDRLSFDIYLCHMIFIKGIFSVTAITKSAFIGFFLTLSFSIVNAMVVYWISKSLKKLLTIVTGGARQ